MSFGTKLFLRWSDLARSILALVLVALLLVVGISEGASDSREVVQASEILAKIERGEPVEYDDVIVEGDLYLSSLDLPTERVERTEYEIKFFGLTEEVKVVKSPITITNSEIHGNVSFGDTIFLKQVIFGGTVIYFHQEPGLHGKQPIMFSLIADSQTLFSGYASFNGALFNGDADFTFAKFSGYASFNGALFNGDADFTFAEFSGDADFSGALFTRNANFWRAEFSGDASFLRAKFSGHTDFWGAKFNGDADFTYAEFSGHVYFSEALFNDDADFTFAEFSSDADFTGALFSDKLSSKMNFGSASFGGNATFVDTQFSQYADFREARFNNSLNLTHARFDRLELRWGSIEKHLNCDDTAYMALIKNYDNLAWFEDADNCLYDYREWRRENSEFGITKLLDYAALVSCGYGVKPRRPLILGLIMVMVCAVYYRRTKAIKRHEKEGDHQEANIWDAFYFSMMTFTTVGYGDWYPLDEHRKLVMFEGIVGWLTLSLFLVTLANVVIR